MCYVVPVTSASFPFKQKIFPDGVRRLHCMVSFLVSFFFASKKKVHLLFLLYYTISCTHCTFVQPSAQDICTKVQVIRTFEQHPFPPPVFFVIPGLKRQSTKKTPKTRRFLYGQKSSHVFIASRRSGRRSSSMSALHCRLRRPLPCLRSRIPCHRTPAVPCSSWWRR